MLSTIPNEMVYSPVRVKEEVAVSLLILVLDLLMSYMC